ncbi:MAG: hypothetical protein A3A86_06730 [Elusimicrobia bacterium RIFCSPLOWO2_01_FULL_60_11]|nr:MAG: hypothetical protein A3A86_06730 [Elusimicrobia bacterium RIFCSPLOWO2_01_FULL_60_11]
MNPDDIKINLKRSYPVPRGFADRVMARIQEESPAEASWRGWLSDLLDLKWEVGAAAFASLFVLVYSLVPQPMESKVLQDNSAQSIFDDESDLFQEVADE